MSLPVVRRSVRLTASQAAFRQSPALFRGFVGGRGSGKSYAGAYDLIRRAERGRVYMAVGPTYPNLRDSSMRTLIKLGRDLNVIAPDSVRESAPPRLTTTTGAEILFRSGDDPERLRGPSLAGAWLDEASLMKKDVFDVMIACLRDEGRQGWLSSTFTPKGMNHWTYEVFATGRPDTELVRSRTDQNPFLPAGFAATIAAQYDDLFAAQELGGEFVDVDGAEWPGAYFGEGVWFDDWPRPEDVAVTVIALDPSRGKGQAGDYAAYVVVKVDRQARLWVDAVMLKGGSIYDIVARGVGLAAEYRPNRLVVETNIGQELLAGEFDRQLRAASLPLAIDAVENWTNKEVRIRSTLGKYLSRDRFRFRRTAGGKLLVGQLQTFPKGQHDDAADALELGVRRIELMQTGPTRSR